MSDTIAKRSLADVELDEFGRPVHHSRLKTYWAKLRSNLSSLGYISVLLILSYLPYRLAYGLAARMGRRRYQRDRDAYATRALMMELRLKATPDQIDHWLRRTVELSVIEDLETWLMPRMTRDEVKKIVTIEGKEHLDAAIARGKGVFLYTGHLWSAYTMWNTLGLYGYAVTMFKHLRFGGRHNWIEQRFNDRRVRLMEKVGHKLLYTSPPNPLIAPQATNAVRRGGIAGALIDGRRPHADDVYVDFLNQVTNFPQVPAMIARITGAAAIGMWVHRPESNLPLTIKLTEPLYIKGNHIPYIQQMADVLEAEIKQEPPSWSNWLFRLFAI